MGKLRSKMRLIISLNALMISSCASTPKIHLTVNQPKGRICTFDAKLKTAFCSQIGTGLGMSLVTTDDMDKWILFDPSSYQSVMDYLSDLKGAL